MIHELQVVTSEKVKSKAAKYIYLVSAVLMGILMVLTFVIDGTEIPIGPVVSLFAMILLMISSYLNAKALTIKDTLIISPECIELKNSGWNLVIESIDSLYINNSLMIKYIQNESMHEIGIPLDIYKNKGLSSVMMDKLKDLGMKINPDIEFGSIQQVAEKDAASRRPLA